MQKLLAIAFLLFSIFTCTLYSQVNTESLRRKFTQDTLLQNVSIGFQLAKGNSEYFGLSAGYRIDLFSGNCYTFISSSLEYKEANESKLFNKGFVHLRFIYNLSDIFATETFIQKEFNEFILLKDRNLLGTGLRISINDLLPKDETQDLNIDFGTGIMAENELLNLNPDSTANVIRWTNYFALKWLISDFTKLTTVFYYQTAVNNFDNFRILNDTRIEFKITKYLNFFTSLNYRFNNQPPIIIKKYDLFINNGLTINF